MDGYVRCPICGERMHPSGAHRGDQGRGFDCGQRHARTTSPETWEQARIQQYIDDAEAFLRPADTIECAEHEWVVEERVGASFEMLLCSACGAWAPRG